MFFGGRIRCAGMINGETGEGFCAVYLDGRQVIADDDWDADRMPDTWEYDTPWYRLMSHLDWYERRNWHYESISRYGLELIEDQYRDVAPDGLYNLSMKMNQSEDAILERYR